MHEGDVREAARSLLEEGLPADALDLLFADAPPDLVAAAIDAARTAPYRELCVSLLAAAAKSFSGGARASIVDEALAIARSIDDPAPRARALTSVAAAVDGERRDALLAEAESATLSIDHEVAHEPRAARGEHELERLRRLSADDRVELLRRIILELAPRASAMSNGDGAEEPDAAPPPETGDRDVAIGDRLPRRPGEREPELGGAVGAEAPDPQDAERAPGSPRAEPRWLSAVVHDATGSTLEKAFRADAQNTVSVDIGPLRQEVGRVTATGTESIDAALARGQSHELVIMFEVPDLQVFGSQRLILPPTGASEPVLFTFRAPAQGSPVSARMTALHGNRVLQTANLKGVALDDPAAAPAGFQLTLELAAIRPGLGDLDFRRPFDVAVIAGHLGDGRPVATSVADLDVARFEDEGLGKASERIIALLTDLADHPEQFADGLDSPAAVKLIRDLALEGRALHDALGSRIVEQLPGVELSRLQVVSDAEDFIPVEFIYDGPVPSFEASLCPNWRSALIDGKCPAANHSLDGVTGLAGVVCPSGFWAITKVVERQVVAGNGPAVDLDDADFAIVAGPSRDRPTLRALGSALFAASRKVRDEDAEAVLEALSETTGGRSSRVSTWPDWISRVASDDPALLVLLSHSTRSRGAIALEIGQEEQFPLVGITNTFVSVKPRDPPVVLLLGCETANADKDLQSFVGRIKQNGAALVVGTIAPVLGRHAAPVALALIHGLHRAGTDAARDNGAAGAQLTFGDLMLRLRRTVLADGHLMALCLTSFGDADWRLATPGTS